MKPMISLMTLFIAGTTLTACTQATPEDMSQDTQMMSPLIHIGFLVGIVAIFCLAFAFAFLQLKKNPNFRTSMWTKVFAFVAIVGLTTCLFPLNIQQFMDFSTLDISMIGLSLAAMYIICDIVKSTFSSQPRTTQMAIIFGGGALGMVCRYLVEFGEVSNTYNFTPLNIIVSFAALCIVFLLHTKIRILF